jgi:hypothetical protein
VLEPEEAEELQEELGIALSSGNEPRKYPCPCCGYVVFDEPPGSYEICPICFWEDDGVQLRWPDWSGGANKPSLIEAQKAFEQIGACEERLTPHVRPPGPGDVRDRDWRPIDLSKDSFEARGVKEKAWPDDPTILYWWRPTFWRRPNDEAQNGPEARN